MVARKLSRSLVIVLSCAALVLTACGSGSNDTQTTPTPTPPDPSMVTSASIGTTWLTNDTRMGGTVGMYMGPEVNGVFGAGALEMTTTDTMGGSSQAKAQLFNYDYIGPMPPGGMGTRLDEITALSYWVYRDGASTNNVAQTVSLNIEVDFVGDGSSYTTLVFEPTYNVYQQLMATDLWQFWDAFDGGNAIWWSTKDIPGVCAFNCYVTWNNILLANPNARIVGGLGFNCGSGWAGDFRGLVDGLTVGVNGQNITYDYEP
jgi:hypothetical protein